MSRMIRLQCMLVMVVTLASSANSAALRDKEIYLIRKLADELAKDLDKTSEDTRPAELEEQGTIFSY